MFFGSKHVIWEVTLVNVSHNTTFGTQVEGYKLYIPLFLSNHTDKWEMAGIWFLSTGTKEKVHAGVKFFKASLP